jgi:hypothetical protein
MRSYHLLVVPEAELEQDGTIAYRRFPLSQPTRCREGFLSD